MYTQNGSQIKRQMCRIQKIKLDIYCMCKPWQIFLKVSLEVALNTSGKTSYLKKKNLHPNGKE